MKVTGYLSDALETEPEMAIVLHRAGDRRVGTIHKILEAPDGGAPMLDSGNLCTHEMVRDLGNRLAGSNSARMILPANVLLADSDLLVWWRPSVRRTIFFKTRNLEFNADVDGRPALQPALLFAGRQNSLCVYALAADDRPDASSSVFRAPYFNIYADGLMCPGSAPLPQAPRPSADCIAAYERAFYDSSFAHTNLGNANIVNWPNGHNAFWRAMAETDSRDFPIEALVPLIENGTPLTVERLINVTPSDQLRIAA